MKLRNYLKIAAVLTGLILLNTCKEDFLEITPNGSLDENVLASYDGVDGLLIGEIGRAHV